VALQERWLLIRGTIYYYFDISLHLKSDLIRGVVFGRSGLIRGVEFGKNGLIRGVFGRTGLIRGEVFGRSGLIRGVAFGRSGPQAHSYQSHSHQRPHPSYKAIPSEATLLIVPLL
jgi:hypothetical protein